MLLTNNSEVNASNVTNEYADDWMPPEDETVNMLNDTCYNKKNCEACWKEDCFSQADKVYEECQKNITTWMIAKMTANNDNRTSHRDAMNNTTNATQVPDTIDDTNATQVPEVMNNTNATQVPESMNSTNATQVPEAVSYDDTLYYDDNYCSQLGTEAYQECGYSCFFCDRDLKACSTSELLDTIRIENNEWANEKAPEPWVAFCLGGIFCFLGAIHWSRRFFTVFQNLDVSHRSNKAVLFRAALVTLGDDDEPLFTIIRTMAQGFLFLGGFQMNYRLTLRVLFVVYFFVSLRDTFRVLVAYHANKKVEDFVVVPSKKGVANQAKRQGSMDGVWSWIELKTKNIYENLSRDFFVVGMVFTTQALLIAFVIVDVYNEKDTHTNIAGTETVPVVGTNSSYCIYILGIFMSVVYLVGPKTNFGQSKENPHYWVQLLLIAKLTGATCKWHNPVKGIDNSIQLRPGDKRIWLRFFLSFIVNGWGFHVLVHLLPIQVAAESSFTGVVFRAVGMMYLIDMDNTPSVTLTLHEGLDGDKKQQQVSGDKNENDESKADNLLEALRRESSLMQSKILEMQQLQDSLAFSIRTSPMACEPILENIPGHVSDGQGASTTAQPIDDSICPQTSPVSSSRALVRGNTLLNLTNIEPNGSSDSPGDQIARDDQDPA